MNIRFKQSLGGVLYDRKWSIIRGSLRNDFIEVVEALKEDSNCINDQDERSGVTALHVAAGDGNVKLVKFLLEQPGCDPLIMDYEGRYSNYMASAVGQIEISDMINAHIARYTELASIEDCSAVELPSQEATSRGTVINFKPRSP